MTRLLCLIFIVALALVFPMLSTRGAPLPKVADNPPLTPTEEQLEDAEEAFTMIGGVLSINKLGIPLFQMPSRTGDEGDRNSQGPQISKASQNQSDEHGSDWAAENITKGVRCVERT